MMSVPPKSHHALDWRCVRSLTHRADPAVSSPAAACQRIVDQEHHDRTGNRDKHAVKVQPGNTFLAEEAEQISPDNRPHDPKQDVEQETLALPVDNLASDKPCDKSKYNPTQNAHLRISLCGTRPDHSSHPSARGTVDPDQRQ